jgi:hypothetical protein
MKRKKASLKILPSGEKLKPYEVINGLIEDAAEMKEIIVVYVKGDDVYLHGSCVEDFDRLIGHVERIKNALLP